MEFKITSKASGKSCVMTEDQALDHIETMANEQDKTVYEIGIYVSEAKLPEFDGW